MSPLYQQEEGLGQQVQFPDGLFMGQDEKMEILLGASNT